MGFGVWGSGCGVWGVGFGVWGLGCGIWGSAALLPNLRGCPAYGFVVSHKRDRSSPPPQKSRVHVLWGARRKEARERGERERERRDSEREREERQHSPFALKAPIQWSM